MRECRAEGCPHIAADGCDYCTAHDEDQFEDPGVTVRQGWERNNGPTYEPTSREHDG